MYKMLIVKLYCNVDVYIYITNKLIDWRSKHKDQQTHSIVTCTDLFRDN